MERFERQLRLEALYTDHAAAVGAYVARRSGPASAEDVVMEVFVIACRRLEAIPSEPLPWLLGCARRVLANQRRGARRADALTARIALAGGGEPARTTDDGRVAAALGGLGERDREVLFLSAWEGLEPSAIATVLGCSPVAARMRLHRARARLAAAIGRGERSLDPGQAVEVTP
jgi:RNA polymerase sigma-70 factor (ECF subfamily)